MKRREDGGGSAGSRLLWAYRRDVRIDDDHRERLSFAGDHDLAMMNTFYITCNGSASHTFYGKDDKKPFDYIFTRK